MEGQINVLKESQSVIQRSFTNFKKSPKDRLTVEYIEVKQDLLEKNWSVFKDCYTNIHANYKRADIPQLQEMYDDTEDTYVNYNCLMKSLLNKHRKEKESVKSEECSSKSKSQTSYVKLPKIAIPYFSGRYGEWTTFRDLFLSLVHNDNSLDDVQRMHYLKTHLSGEAEQLVRHIPISEANYSQCWSKLEKRYSNKKYLVRSIMKRLFGQKRIHVESAISLKELLDTTNDCLGALRNLDVNVTTWDIIIIHIVTFKLDSETRKQWELHVSNQDSDELPTYAQFSTFIENRFRALECIEPKRAMAQHGNSSHGHKSLLAVSSSSIQCEYCSEEHKLCFCKKFAKQSINRRRDFVANNKICFNCLGSNHTVANCKKQTICKLCKKRHHSLLHLNDAVVRDDSASAANTSDNGTSSAHIISCLSKNISLSRQVLLATALVKAESKTGKYHVVRALLDQGSQACLITEATVQYLRLPRIPIQGVVSGLGNSSNIAKYMVHLKIQSRVDQTFTLELDAYVLNKITSHLPQQCTDKNAFEWVNMAALDLADPQFDQPNRIDILLGAEAYSCILKEGMRKSPSCAMVAQNTTLGWILSGAITNGDASSNTSRGSIMFTHVAQFREDDLLKRFWEIEELQPKNKILTPEELRCEELYKATTKRSEDGKYIVRLPFRDEDPPCKAGSSRAIAETRLKALERRLEKNKDLKEKYTDVIHEYLHLGHMKPVNKNDDKREIAVYLPHHAVIREDKSTSKVRVVFNASAKNKNGVSLNDTLMVGPTLQADLRHIVTKWRVHPIGLVADVIKMYRQVQIHEEDVMYQRILWRDEPTSEIREYELVTVTFGTASAPYQAVRTLHQIAYDEGTQYPLVADRVLNNFYMDDLMTGCSDVKEGVDIFNEITALLRKGGFLLQKWNSSSQELLEKINSIKQKDADENKEDVKAMNANRTHNIENNYEKTIEIKTDNTTKILGLTWNRHKDFFQYTLNLPPLNTTSVTKRTIISDIARLFDPLGWLAPSIVIAKIFIQKLWLAGVGWDERISVDLQKEWATYREELPLIANVRIPRWFGVKSGDDIELHGFCDASKNAYAAVVYLRITDVKGNITVALVAAKSRVAPIKQVSIPRLELCGAVLLSKLLIEVADILKISKDKIKAWTDSTIVLAWLSSHPSRWKTFVGNRTSEILTMMEASQWSHVSTRENPADCASRGVSPSLLVHNTLWFSGPQFLKDTTIIYKRPMDAHTNLEQSVNTHFATVPDDTDFFERFSSLKRLLRVIAYCRRFLNQTTNKKTYLQNQEIQDALDCCIIRTQKQIFTIERAQLEEKGHLELKSSRLKSLCPYLDQTGIMRVQGRLERAPVDEQLKHPILLPSSTHFTHLLILDAHHKTLHGGPQLMMNFLRSAYWILGVRNLVRKCVRQCVTCIKQRATIKNQMMGSLPTIRCTPARPFLHSGVDYAGPISIRTSKGRGHRSYKGYICVFICMATRAIHLEVASDMTSQAFIAAFRRFVSRRGHCAKLWSDNGTTFVGAAKELQELAKVQPSIVEHLEANGTEWHFIPPHAPNFGGLWEAGVKSTKFHLKRVIGDSTLTFEELSTFLYQVEACLNSRPISVINSEDPSEPMPLTPGHFLIGEPIVTVPDAKYESSHISSLTRWQLLQRMLQSFWKRWSHEYLANLMNRYKWSSKVPEPKIGDVVLIKEDDLPPSRWSLGRVVEKHTGHDDLTRVVTLRTKTSTVKRPTNKLCILPTAD